MASVQPAHGGLLPPSPDSCLGLVLENLATTPYLLCMLSFEPSSSFVYSKSL